MSAGNIIKVTAAIYALALLLSSLAAHAQEMNHMPTIADCPAGYVLGVQQTDQLMPMASAPPTYAPSSGSTPSYLEQQAEDQKRAAAQPRQFITGCVPVQQYQQR